MTGILSDNLTMVKIRDFEKLGYNIEYNIESETENYILNELVNLLKGVSYYWKSGNTAEVDFIAQSNDKIIPVEVKSALNVKSRSLSIYRDKYKPEVSVRTSMQNIKNDEGLINIPLYIFLMIKTLIQ